MIELRPYQAKDEAKIYAAWLTCTTVLHRADTGYGKTAVIASIVSKHVGASVVIAHRDTIVSQLSLMLARFGIRHNIIAPAQNCRHMAELHVKELGRNFYDPNSPIAVASVDTLTRRKGIADWAKRVTLAVVDEGHHVVLGNKWDKGLDLFTNPLLKILLPTATPRRADGKGLGTPELGGDGRAEIMVLGPPMQWLMDQGYLTTYFPPIIADSHMTELLGKVGSDGDWSVAQRREAAEKSTIVGDVVKSYQRVCAGFYDGIHAGQKLAVVFAPEVKTATDMLQAYRAAGIKAELLTGDTDADVRRRVFQDFEARQTHVIVAVDIISEGTDMPAVEAIIMARSTASLQVYMQQFGRGLRPMWGPIGHNGGPSMDETPEGQAQRLQSIALSGKPALVFVDHVGNFLRHGPPNRFREWALVSTRGSNGSSGAKPQRVCLNEMCSHPYERHLAECPYCGTPAPEPDGRSSPDMVEGDLVMMDPAILDALLGKVKEAGLSLDEYRHKLAATGLPQAFIWANAKKHDAKLKARAALVEIMEFWGGPHHAAGLSDREIQRLFWLRFGLDVATAQTLDANETETLMARIALDVGST